MKETKKTCSNCSYSHFSCGLFICQWHEAYVTPTTKCSWWTKKVDKGRS